ncbi:MAG: hypothetical protein QNJ63_02130 [Calothrix sp. MO_192.B10]|nr:hypothetical protein [Calothrix sp. MO_192.B10]
MLIQFRNRWLIFVKIYTPILLFLLLVIFLNFVTGIPISKFTRDPAAIADINPFFGLVSNIGILLWCGTVSICFFSSTIIRKYNQHIDLYKVRDFSNFLMIAGFITLILLLDDLFLFHELVFPIFLKIPGKFLYASYAIIISWYFFRFRNIIIKTEWTFLFLSLLCFGTSIIIDALRDILDISIYQAHLFEDGFKLLGIFSWLSYFVKVSFKVLFRYALEGGKE